LGEEFCGAVTFVTVFVVVGTVEFMTLVDEELVTVTC
jgi:hypothetical protein